MSLARNPALWTGLALIVLGGGNWINGRQKIDEYQALSEQPAQATAVSSPQEYPNLNDRTAAALLEPLRTSISTRSYAEGKRDFYRVVLTGGRLIVLFGAFLVVAATYWERRREAAAPL